MYGISSTSQQSAIFATGTKRPESTTLPVISKGTSLYGVNNAKPSLGDNLLLSLKVSANDFQNSLSGLTLHKINPGQSVSNSNEAVLTLNDTEALSSDMDVSVSQLAKGQVSKTNSMRLEALDFELGEQSLSFQNAMGDRVQVTLHVQPEDTNASVLGRLAEGLNAADVGVDASVTTDKRSGLAAMEVSSFSGAMGAFEVTSERGSLVETTGLSVAVQAQDAQYTVNDAAYSSPINDVDLEGISVTLQQTGSTSLVFDRSADAVNAFVSSYNQLHDANEKVAVQLDNASAAYRKGLTEAGFSFDDEGHMSVEDVGLALESGGVESLLGGGSNFGYSEKLSQISQMVERSPQVYAQQDGNTYSSYNSERLSTQQNQLSFMLGSFYHSIM